MSTFRNTRADQSAAGFPVQLVQNFMGVAITTNASGDATYTFPTAFPNGLYGFQVTDASNAAPPGLGAIILKAYTSTTGASDRTKVSFRAYQTSGAVLPSTGFTVNITAYGW